MPPTRLSQPSAFEFLQDEPCHSENLSQIFEGFGPSQKEYNIVILNYYSAFSPHEWFYVYLKFERHPEVVIKIKYFEYGVRQFTNS